MVKVLFDHQKFSEQQYGGISRYFANLVTGANSHPDFDAELGMLYNQNYYLSQHKFALNNLFGHQWFKVKPSRISKWNKQYSKYLISRNDFDLLHPTYYNPYFLNKLKKPYILTVHDMIYELYPEIFPADEKTPAYKKETIKDATGLIAISETTKQDLINILKVSPQQIKVIRHGIESIFAIEKSKSISFDYLLFVGERSNYKNFDTLLYCFKQLTQQYPELLLVCAGGGAFTTEEKALQQKLGVKNKCLQLIVNDDQLNGLYLQALVFVFPSKYEGFGYPMLEAFRARCAVAASNTGSLPEVGGDAAVYFSPDNINEMYTAIDSLLKDTSLRKDHINKGIQRLKLFPLQHEIDETLNFYKQLIK